MGIGINYGAEHVHNEISMQIFSSNILSIFLEIQFGHHMKTSTNIHELNSNLTQSEILFK